MDLQLPISTDKLIRGEKLNRISTQESIYRHLQIVLQSHYGSLSYNSKYGCSIWSDDFDVIVTNSSWTSDLAVKIKNDFIQNEPRILPNFDVNIQTMQVDEEDKNSRQYFLISLSGLTTQETKEKMTDLQFALAFSPLTIQS